MKFLYSSTLLASPSLSRPMSPSSARCTPRIKRRYSWPLASLTDMPQTPIFAYRRALESPVISRRASAGRSVTLEVTTPTVMISSSPPHTNNKPRIGFSHPSISTSFNSFDVAVRYVVLLARWRLTKGTEAWWWLMLLSCVVFMQFEEEETQKENRVHACTGRSGANSCEFSGMLWWDRMLTALVLQSPLEAPIFKLKPIREEVRLECIKRAETREYCCMVLM